MLERVWRKGNPATLLWGGGECKFVQSLRRIAWRFLKKLKIELSYNPAIPLVGIYLEKTIIRKDICTPMFIAGLYTIAKTWKQPRCPSTDEWIKKKWYVCTVEYYSAIKRNETVSPAVTWMDLGMIILSEISQRRTNVI